jgi:hypothetical protein
MIPYCLTIHQDTVESIILGIDCASTFATIGLVLPVWADATVTLDGDGGFSLVSNNRLHIFKPVSVQAMWSSLQSLHRVIDTARCCNYFPGGLTHTWISYYEAKIASNQVVFEGIQNCRKMKKTSYYTPLSLWVNPFRCGTSII